MLPKSSALMEFVRYQSYDPQAGARGRFQETRYAAYVLKPNGEIKGVDLGSEAEIEPRITALIGVLRDPRFPEKQVKEAAHALEEIILAPLQAELSGVDHLLISPDDALNLIPFEALVDAAGQYLVESYEISYLTSGRDLLRLQTDYASVSPALLVAGPYLSRVASASNGLRNVREDTYPPLPGTGAEARAIAAKLSEADLRQGEDATEAAIKQANRPRILHVATHGFFEPVDESAEESRVNALLRSGLVLSGFRLGQSGPGEDGILTALEMNGLNLLGTELVVLSACDTGLGDLSVGEGVYGLRRGLVLAGAESQVISLWQVQDRSTQELMVAYYDNLLAEQGRSAALRQVQLEMIDSDNYSHPYFWAAFINSGDWTPLE